MTAKGWLVSPAFDLLFLANVGWLLVLVPGFLAADGKPYTEFWQVYFLTAPHRWLTLGLVAVDPDRREGRTGTFLILAIVALAAVVGARWFTGAFLCLALIDTLWNGWHFAAQHYGVLRIYSRQTAAPTRLEQWLLRPFLVYVAVRVVNFTLGWFADEPNVLAGIRVLDLVMMTLPLSLLVRELGDRPATRPGKTAYLLSVCVLYCALLLAVRQEASRWVIALAAASATFHAVEYLALVTYYAWRRQNTGSTGLFQLMAGRWLGVLAVYVVVLGLLSAAAERYFLEVWVGLNLWAAFLHYAYDGMIWKLRRPETARVLGAAG